MPLSKVVFLSIGIGVLFGVAFMSIMNGVMGYHEMKEALVFSMCFCGFASGALFSMLYKIKERSINMNKIKSWFNEMWEKHICADFPYPDECWSCKRQSCKGCPVKRYRK
jgi:hypothetical protein